VFAHPEQGVIPLGVNNVDAVVNANAVYALALTGQRATPGYRDAMHLVARCALERHWPEAGLYYPQQMMFPYAASRAWREGGAREPEMTQAMRRLLKDLLDLQDSHARRHPLRAGGFPGGVDPSEAMATAMGLSALLHLGEATAREIGEERRYGAAVERAVKRLLALARRRPRLPGMIEAGPAPVSWEAGLFFAASFHDLAHWRSEAVTTAAAMEALAKYALEFDRDGAAPRQCLVIQARERRGLRLRVGPEAALLREAHSAPGRHAVPAAGPSRFAIR
jgi:hypothetical protein